MSDGPTEEKAFSLEEFFLKQCKDGDLIKVVKRPPQTLLAHIRERKMYLIADEEEQW